MGKRNNMVGGVGNRRKDLVGGVEDRKERTAPIRIVLSPGESVLVEARRRRKKHRNS